MAAACPARPPHPLQPGSPATAVLAADRSPRRSVAAPQIGCPFRCPTQICPCATAPPAARRAQIHCWLAPRHLHGQRPTAPAIASGAAGTAPPPSGPGCSGHAAVAALAALGALSTVAATLPVRTLLLGSALLYCP